LAKKSLTKQLLPYSENFKRKYPSWWDTLIGINVIDLSNM